MRHYKAPDNSLHCIDPEHAHLLPAGCVEITDDEAEELRAAQAPKATAEQVRADRDARIASSDWTQLADAPLTTAEKSAWKKYRQDLRDVPEQSGFPAEIVWPVAPN